MVDIPYSEIPKVVLVCRQTRYKELLTKYRTASNARFYLESLGADFDDYENEDIAYEKCLQVITQELQLWGRYQIIDRQYLPNYVFAKDDIIVVLGQDGLVANTLKYLTTQPVIGVNPDVNRWDGLLLPFHPADLASLLPEVWKGSRSLSEITMAEVTLSDGQSMLAVNDFFVGARTHTSARYEIDYQGTQENQSSSGLIVSTGLGSTAWISSIVAGSNAVVKAMSKGNSEAEPVITQKPPLLSWDTDHLLFAVREPFASKRSSTEIVYGEISKGKPLTLRSNMPDNGVIFSDGIESDFIRFDAGLEASIGVSDRSGHLVQ